MERHHLAKSTFLGKYGGQHPWKFSPCLQLPPRVKTKRSQYSEGSMRRKEHVECGSRFWVVSRFGTPFFLSPSSMQTPAEWGLLLVQESWNGMHLESWNSTHPSGGLDH
uniref:Uncharacterized protein n=1 Tax=Lygus hesperus TaxID=30085 RepID=A0A146LBT6_LYGHE